MADLMRALVFTLCAVAYLAAACVLILHGHPVFGGFCMGVSWATTWFGRVIHG